MKILFDLRSWQISHARGIGRYFLGLFNAMVCMEGVEAYALISEKYDVPIPPSVSKNAQIYILERWAQYKVAKGAFDFFFRGNMFDYGYCNTFDVVFPEDVMKCCDGVVAIMHDLIPLLFPKDYLSNNMSRLGYGVQLETLRVVDHFFANSKCTRDDCIRLGVARQDQMTVIYGSTDEEWFKITDFQDKYDFSRRRNAVCAVVGDDVRKNYPKLAKAFARALNEKKIPEDSTLFLVCASSKEFKKNVEAEIAEYAYNVKSKIVITGFVDDAVLKTLISTSKASIFPSLYEGLGLPILESYRLDTPCFTSNLSSTAEFAAHECTFDPYDLNEVEQAVVDALTNENLCRRSIEFGRQLIDRVSWESAAKITYSKLKELLTEQKDGRFLMFSTLPPDQTGIAAYGLSMAKASKKIDVVGRFDSLRDYEEIKSSGVNNVFSEVMLPYLPLKVNYVGKLFVFGNSKHHEFSLRSAIHSKGEKGRALYLHEGQLFWMFAHHLNNDVEKVKDFICTWYPYLKNDARNKNTLSDLSDFMESQRIGCIRPLVEMTGIRKIFVNNECARDWIVGEFTGNAFEGLIVKVLFHPIPEFARVQVDEQLKKFARGRLIVGSFGIPRDSKQSEDVICAVKHLNEIGIASVLVLAGYKAQSFVSHFGLAKDFIYVVDAPSDEKLFSLMNTVDVAVQLRKRQHGESSGCISQLLGLNKKIVTTEGFVSNDIAKVCTVIPSNSDSIKIAEAITQAVSNDDCRSLDMKKYSCKNLCDLIYTSFEGGVNAN